MYDALVDPQIEVDWTKDAHHATISSHSVFLFWIFILAWSCHISQQCYLFQLLHKEAGRRLGSGPGGSDEIKNHKWFKSVNWKRLEARQIQPSFRPNVAGKTCIANFDECWTNMPVLDSPVASPVAANSNFVGFSYVRPAPFLQKPSPLAEERLP